MKKILSLAIILSCAFTSASWAAGPGGNSHGQQQVWQPDAGRGEPGEKAETAKREDEENEQGQDEGDQHGASSVGMR